MHHPARLGAAEPSQDSSAGPFTLDELLAIAVREHPELAAAQARTLTARGRLIQAGLYPNPTVGVKFDDLGHDENGWGAPGIVIGQTIVRGGKLRLAEAAAAAGVDAADWQAMARWYDVVTRVRLAFIELLAAERERATIHEIVQVAQRSYDAAKTLRKVGAGSEPDVLRAEVELNQNILRRTAAEQRVQAAQRLLGNALGWGRPVERVEGNLEAAPPQFVWDAALGRMLMQSAELQQAEAQVVEAERLWQRARAEPTPNLDVMANPFYSAPERDWRAEIQLAVVVPLWQRNQGDILAAQAELDRARHEARAVELRLRERLAASWQRYETARQQVEGYRKNILPKARASLELFELGYKGGDPKYDYTALLQAQQVLFQAQLDYVRVLEALGRAVAEIQGLVQEDQ
jgi:cobalt-zinc-cadmium efflux system outer membrane protein